MPLVVFYLQLHQPFRLHPERKSFLWDDLNREVFERVAQKSYLPGLEMFCELLAAHSSFKITLSMSGTFLEQAESFRPEVIDVLLRLKEKCPGQVEFLQETYYHSLASLFADPQKKEFHKQVSLHRKKIFELFGDYPTSFRNTELMYNNEIAVQVADLGYLSILCEKRPDMFIGTGRPISPNAVFRSLDGRLLVIPRNRELSDDIAFRFPQRPISPEEYAASLAMVDGEAVLLGFDFEHLGEHIWDDRGIFDFWRKLPPALENEKTVIVTTPGDVAERFKGAPCPVVDIHGLATSSWADDSRDTQGWLGNLTQYGLFQEIEKMEESAGKAGGELLQKWRYLTTSDHVYFLHEGRGGDQAVHSYFNPYGGSVAQAAHVLTRKIDQLNFSLKRVETARRHEKTPVLIISPETGRLPEDMGALAKYVSGKSGGQGEVVSALCEGLSDKGIDVHLITLNLKRRFQREAGLDDKQWREMRYRIDPENIHLVSSAVFADNLSAYEGDPLATAAEFQRQIINNLVKEIRSRHGGRLIIHSHDWMAGGIIAAYARATGIPVLHTVHNVFTAHLPLSLLGGIPIRGLEELIYFSSNQGISSIDCQATAIKNATLINFVGERFLEEVVRDYFLDREIIPPSVRQEVKAKFENDAALAVINAPSHNLYPEVLECLARKYGPKDDILRAKKKNLLEFQRRTGLNINPEAVLFYWPSRLDPFQKGVELLIEVALPFVSTHPEAQIAVVADGVGGDLTQKEAIVRIALASSGRITYQPYSQELSLLGYAAAADVFGASLYEPCGQIDQIGNIFGATATNRDTGGYHDKIKELSLKRHGAPRDTGNGFLFRDYDPGGLWYGLTKSLAFHLLPAEIRNEQLKRIMSEAREAYSLEKMIESYIGLYERLMPLGSNL